MEEDVVVVDHFGILPNFCQNSFCPTQSSTLTVPSAGLALAGRAPLQAPSRMETRSGGGELISGGRFLPRQAHLPPKVGDGLETYTPAEHHKRGFFLVESILKHKFKQNYQFLTKWSNFPIEDATWEPIQSFIQPNGFINETFKEYCRAQGLDRAYRQALKLSEGPSTTH